MDTSSTIEAAVHLRMKYLQCQCANWHRSQGLPDDTSWCRGGGCYCCRHLPLLLLVVVVVLLLLLLLLLLLSLVVVVVMVQLLLWAVVGCV